MSRRFGQTHWNLSARRRRLAGATLFLAFLPWGLVPPPAAAQSEPETPASPTYFQELNKARSDADAGRTADARKRLESTDASQRSFEFEYLTSRIDQTPTEGKPSPDLVRKLPRPEVETRYGVLNETNRHLVFICRDGGLRIHDLTSPETPQKTVAHPGAAPIWSGAFSRDGKRFFSGHQNGEVLVWDARTWELQQTLPLGGDWPVRELVAAPDGASFAAETKAELELWSLAGDAPRKVAGIGPRYNFGEGLAFSPKGDLLATGGMFDILLHDAKTGEQKKSLRHASYTMGLEFSPDGKRIASAPRGNVNKFLAVFDVAQDEPLFNAGPFGNYIAGMAFSPDGKRIAATGCEKMLRLFDSMTGEVVLTLKRPECGSKPAFSRDGRLLGWSEPDGYWYIELGAAPESKAADSAAP